MFIFITDDEENPFEDESTRKGGNIAVIVWLYKPYGSNVISSGFLCNWIIFQLLELKLKSQISDSKAPYVLSPPYSIREFKRRADA